MRQATSQAMQLGMKLNAIAQFKRDKSEAERLRATRLRSNFTGFYQSHNKLTGLYKVRLNTGGTTYCRFSDNGGKAFNGRVAVSRAGAIAFAKGRNR